MKTLKIALLIVLLAVCLWWSYVYYSVQLREVF